MHPCQYCSTVGGEILHVQLHGMDLNQLFDCMATVNCNENLMAVDGSRTLSLGVVALVASIKVRGRVSGTKDAPAQFSQILQLRRYFSSVLVISLKLTIRDISIITYMRTEEQSSIHTP